MSPLSALTDLIRGSRTLTLKKAVRLLIQEAITKNEEKIEDYVRDALLKFPLLKIPAEKRAELDRFIDLQVDAAKAAYAVFH